MASERKTVIELFTSQGCAKCPPADAILRKLSKRSDIVALTLPISYWDYLGWKDTLALEANYERQQAYAKSRGDHEIYTPQIIVNGRIHVIGSHMDQVDAAIKRANAEFSNNRVALSLANKDGVVVLHADEDTAQSGSEPRKATLWVAFFTSSIEVKVNKGENNGQRLVYTNVVRAMTQAGQWKGEAVSYRVPIPHNTSIDGCAGFLQNDKSKEILGVELISLTSKQPLASRF
ncbi:MAG: DUF1223 domain-containing protein [Alphaproteobacteria bacterium]